MRASLVVVGDLNGVSKDLNLKIKTVSIIFEGSSPSEGEQPTSGVLTSPNYPEDYPNNLNLFYGIQVPEGNTIWLRFTELTLEPFADKIRVTDRDGTLLGDSSHYPNSGMQFVSRTNTVEVHFHTDSSTTKRGWRLEWGEFKVKLIVSVQINIVPRNGWR